MLKKNSIIIVMTLIFACNTAIAQMSEEERIRRQTKAMAVNKPTPDKEVTSSGLSTDVDTTFNEISKILSQSSIREVDGYDEQFVTVYTVTRNGSCEFSRKETELKGGSQSLVTAEVDMSKASSVAVNSYYYTGLDKTIYQVKLFGNWPTELEITVPSSGYHDSQSLNGWTSFDLTDYDSAVKLAKNLTRLKELCHPQK